MLARDHWRRLALRGRFDLLYLVSDPGGMRSDAAQARLDWTAQRVAAAFPRVDTLLELGCGEGHLARRLAPRCGQLFGVDPSGLAIARCRRRCPEGLFKVGDERDLGFAYVPPVFDLVVACEMICDLRDTGRAIARLGQLGRACFVTYDDTQFRRLDSWFEPIAEGQDLLECGDSAWRAVWWRSRRTPGGLVAERPR